MMLLPVRRLDPGDQWCCRIRGRCNLDNTTIASTVAPVTELIVGSAASNVPAVVVLDRMLPDNGLSVT